MQGMKIMLWAVYRLNFRAVIMAALLYFVSAFIKHGLPPAVQIVAVCRKHPRLERLGCLIRVE